ncbi:MAG TPA: NAD(+)/NADH kinase [Micromonosporaceae bacterium]
MPIHRLGLVVHHGRAEARAVARSVWEWASAHGVPAAEMDVWFDSRRPRRSSVDEAAAAGHPDLIVTIGGDGTFLRGVRLAAASDAAVLGVNVGRLGFLTSVVPAEVDPALDAVHAGRAEVETRTTLTLRASRAFDLPAGVDTWLRYGRGPALPPPRPRETGVEEVGWGVPLRVVAMNDVVFEKLARDRQASIGVYLEGNLFASYSADALIVATPTGSTAYSFAAGGPVLSPRLNGMVFTPVAPHMAFDRSLVLAGDEVVAVRVLERSGQVAVSVDGQLRGVLDPGDWVAVYPAPWRARLVRLHPSDFYARLKSRFGLADAPAALADGRPPLTYRPDSPPPTDLDDLHLPWVHGHR